MGKKIISITLFTLIAVGLLTSCSLFGGTNQHDLSVSDFYDSDSIIVELEADKIPLTQIAAIPIVIMPVASGRLTESNEKSVIDFSNTADGYVMVKWLTHTDNQLRVRVSGPRDVIYTYTIFPNDTFEVFPLSDCDGCYEVNVFEQVEGNRYALVNTVSFDVVLTDEFAPFLRPNQFVNFNEESDVVMKAAQLVTGSNSLIDKIAAIYEFIIDNIEYDAEFADAVKYGELTGYLPDLDSVLARRKGICFDYAALMTAMLRSQGIPTKLVVGYVGDFYHAWINVFSKETGWINHAIFFDGESWTLMDPTLASASAGSVALKALMGDGSIYTVKYLY